VHRDGVSAPKAQSILADEMGVTTEQRRELLPSGIYPVYKSRIGWAHDRLKREGLSRSVKRGFWQVTEKGLHYAEANPRLAEDEIRRLARPSSDVAISDSIPAGPLPTPAVTAGSPDDNIRTALQEIQQSLHRELLDLIAERDPQFFEQLVLRLLRAIGYGMDSASIEHTGRPGDEGVDGVISLDQLGLDKICVQAKRYDRERTVGGEDVDRFFAAVHRRGATKGVLITSGRFTEGARRAAESARGATIRLIDGAELTLLMMRHAVGVRHEALPIPRLDLDFWEEE